MDENTVVDEMNDVEEEKQEEEEVLTCPVCGEEVEPGTENCPLCGAPVGTLENNDVSGTSIDNSAAIDAMLQSAAMLVEESASLGVELDDDEEPEEDGEDEEYDYDEEGEEGDPMEPVSAAAMPTDLTAEQKSQIEAGGMISLSTGAPPAAARAPKKAPKPKQPKPKQPPKPKKKAKDEPAPEPVLYNMDESGNALPDDLEEAPYTPPSQKTKKPKSKRKSTSPVLVVLTAIVALALGCTAGFFGKTMFFPDVVVPECQEFAERAVLGVNTVTGQSELYVAEAYVSESEDTAQCVFRAIVDSGEGTGKACWYRVKVYSDAPDTVRIYLELDMDKYNAMMNSDDQEQRIQASVLMSNQQELDRCISEIRSGSGSWSAANVGMLNEALRPSAEESDE